MGVMLGKMLGNGGNGKKKPPIGGFTTLLITLILLVFPNGTRSGT